MAQSRRSRSARRQAARAAAGGRVQQGGIAPAPPGRRRGSPGIRRLPKGVALVSGVFIAAIVVGVIANWWVSVRGPNNEPILAVNSRVFTWGEYVRLLKFQKLGAESLGGKFDSGQGPYALMQTMAENELIRQAASREGLSVTDDQARQEMVSRLVPDATKNSGDPNQISREFSVRLQNYLATVQIGRGQYEDIVRNDLLREQLRQKLGETIPHVQSQVFVHMIKVADADADKVADRLKKGEEFASVARKVSTDEDSREKGGEVGWTPRLVFKDIDTLLFGLRPGQVSDPVQTDKGWWLIRLVDRVGDKARLQGILVNDGTTARDVEKRIETGLAFADAAAQLSTDQGVRASRGDLGLVSPGDFGGAFDTLISGIPLKKVSDRISTTDGTMWVMVTDRTSAREVSDKSLDTLKTRALEDWIRREWDANKVNYCPKSPTDCFSNTKVDRALAQIRDVSLTKEQENATATAQAVERGKSGGGSGIPGLQ